MKGGRLVVVDWTRGAPRAGVFAEGLRGWQLEAELSLPPRLVVKDLRAEGVRVLAGEDAARAQEDERTLIFEQPAFDLPRVEDTELQTLLLVGFWRALSQSLVERGHLGADERVAGYVIPPHHFPLPLLENFRAVCAGARPLKLVGCAHEAAALVLGFLRSEAFRPEEGASRLDVPVTICLVVACDEQEVDVVCFDYARATPTRHCVLIRDFFQTTCAKLSQRLHDSDWLGAFSLLIVVEDPALPVSARSALDAPLQAISDGVARERRQTTAARSLKLRGGAHVAFYAAGRAPDAQEYDVAHAYHIGLQIDQQHFWPVVSKDDWSKVSEFPHLAAQAFRLRGRPGSALRLNLYSGYSTRVEDAVPLCQATLWQEDLARLAGVNALTAAVRLDAPCSGEFLLGLMPENRVLRRLPFTLPGLAV